ncbi:MAG: leucine-rich repeat domain-containing protein [Kiritimatiellae bacterium]|nr:leucine-rich repeat domain-containing protein [Kiritimatiellia bacterium]
MGIEMEESCFCKMACAAFSAALALLCAGTVPAGMVTDPDGNVWTYSAAGREATIIAVSPRSASLSIPSAVEGGMPVTAFDASVFAGRTDCVRVAIPESVKAIPDGAFQDCTGLKEITVSGDGLESIGASAFRGCSRLASFTVPDSVTSLGQGAFSWCTALASVTLGDGLVSLPGVEYAGSMGGGAEGTYSDYASGTGLRGDYQKGLFFHCTSLWRIGWGANIREIGNLAFVDCQSLTRVDIPESVNSIGNHAFYGCLALAGVTVRGNVDSIGRYAFADCPSLRYVDFMGDTMTPEPGYRPFAFCRDALAVYAKPGSTGWTGVAGAEGLPADGTWAGVPVFHGTHPVYTIVLHRNDASTEKIAEVEFDHGVWCRIPSIASLGWARRGFEFKGWATSVANAANGKIWKGDRDGTYAATGPGGVLDVYAAWELKPGCYAVDFIRNDGAGTWRRVGFPCGVKTRMPSLANGLGWARRGYVFKGWELTTAEANDNTRENAWKGDWAYLASPVPEGSTLTVYARWELKPGHYQIRFNRNDGTGRWRTLGFARGKSTKLSTVSALGWERDGLSMAGWGSNRENAESGKIWKADGAWVKDATDEGRTLSIYAIWE